MTSSEPELSKTNKVLLSLVNFLAQTPCREKVSFRIMQVCRLVQYFSRYTGACYIEQNDTQPHLRNSLLGKIKKTDSLATSMTMARKILRFGPSINCIKTVIMNTLELIQGKNKEPTPVFILKTLSALFVAMFFICDHYLWLFTVHPLINSDGSHQECQPEGTCCLLQLSRLVSGLLHQSHQEHPHLPPTRTLWP